MLEGWAKIKKAAQYGGTSERTYRGVWLKDGLKHVRLPGGTILTKYEWIDQYLEKYAVNNNEVNTIVEDALKGLK